MSHRRRQEKRLPVATKKEACFYRQKESQANWQAAAQAEGGSVLLTTTSTFKRALAGGLSTAIASCRQIIVVDSSIQLNLADGRTGCLFAVFCVLTVVEFEIVLNELFI